MSNGASLQPGYPPWMLVPLWDNKGCELRLSDLDGRIKRLLADYRKFRGQVVLGAELVNAPATQEFWGVGTNYPFLNAAVAKGALKPYEFDARELEVDTVPRPGAKPAPSSVTGAEGAGDPTPTKTMAEIERLADEKVKANPKLTQVQARDLVFTEKHELYEHYRRETTRHRDRNGGGK